MMSNLQIIGVDGGATKVSAWRINHQPETENFSLSEHNRELSYREMPGFISDFKPAALPEQLASFGLPEIAISEQEAQMQKVYVETCLQCILPLADKSQSGLLIGIGMPGLKTADLRGIAVVANGPRMPQYLALLEQRLAEEGVTLLAPLARLGSDADYCGIGENFAAEGQFRNCRNAYYLGGGTGVADALKLDNTLLPLDKTKSWLAKTWEFKTGDGFSMEKYISVGGMQSLYAAAAGTTVEDLNRRYIYPLQIAGMAAAGDLPAKELFSKVSDQLARLLFERITTLYRGWSVLFEFVNPNRAALESGHPFMGRFFEKLIIGQRLGDLLQSPQGNQELGQPTWQKLEELIRNSTLLDAPAKNHYLPISPRIAFSLLREAPAIGAGIDGYMAFRERQAVHA